MRKPQFYAGVFLTTATTLMLQTVESRILSVISWYHLVFFAVSIAMFGLTAGAVWVYMRYDEFSQGPLSDDLSYFTAAYSISTALLLGVQLSLAPVFSFSVTMAFVWAMMATAMAVPFFFAGIVVSLALTRSPYPLGSVYGVDLMGAAFGCLGAILLLSVTDGPSAILWTATFAIIGSAAFSKSRVELRFRKNKLPLQGILGRPMLIALVLAVAAFGNGLTKHGLAPVLVKDQIERRDASLALERWNSFSRVTVSSTNVRRPMLWGPSPTLPENILAEDKYISIDGSAATSMYRFDGDSSKLQFLRYDITNLAYSLPNRRKAAIIGVGGGRDMLSAWIFGFRDITGIEVNPILVHLLTRDPEYSDFAGIAREPGVRIFVDEARSWLARTSERFDIIQMSMIDTWAATGAGAFTLTENGLYTLEAWDIFWNRLAPHGIFTVSRWYAPGEVNETGRLVSLAMATLQAAGVAEPRRHIFVASVGPIATLILTKSPLSAEELVTLRDTCLKYQYRILISPLEMHASTVLANILSSPSFDDLVAYTSTLPLDLTPPTDNRPFFFNQLPLGRPSAVAQTIVATGSQTGVAKGNLLATVTLFVIIIVSLVLVVFTIVIPLQPAIREVGRGLAIGGTAYFFLIGMGFMLLEMSLLQRMSVFLGHPVYSLSVVLFSLILSTGIGSFMSERLLLNTFQRFAAWIIVTCSYILLLALMIPAILPVYDSAKLLVRCGVTVAIIFPSGLLVGFGFPTGLRLTDRFDRRPAPWFWGINGAAGVLASGLGIIVSVAFGITDALLIGAGCYALLLLAAPRLFQSAELVRAQYADNRTM
jgi:predicted membrane-bound spermidine synthase